MRKKTAGIKRLVLERKKNIIFIGRIYDQKLLGKLYSLANLFVICSSWENFPTTCIEAQCCRTPVCGFDKGGIKETIITEEEYKNNTVMVTNTIGNQNHVSKALVEFGNVRALAELIEKLLEHNNDMEKLCKVAREKYSRERMSNAYLTLYKEIL